MLKYIKIWDCQHNSVILADQLVSYRNLSKLVAIVLCFFRKEKDQNTPKQQSSP